MTDSTNGGQDGRGGGGADPRQLHEELAVWARRKSRHGMVKPQRLLGQGISEVVGQGGDFQLVEAVRVYEADTVLRQLIELLQCLRTPLATALTRRPGFQEARAAMAQDGRWRGIGLQETSRGRLCQVFAHGM